MSVSSAVVFLWTRSARNRVLAQWRRLKNPRYLIAAAAGAAYFYWIFLSRFRFRAGPSEPPSGEGRIFLEATMLGMAVFTVLGAWILGSNKSPLHFTEAEVQFLFPGPLSRRSVLHYRVLKSMLRTGFSALVATVFFRGAWGAHTLLFGIGAWGSFTILALHGTGASLVRESLFTHGRFGWPRRLLTLLVLASALGALGWWVTRDRVPLPEWETLTFDGLASWVGTLLASPPLSWVLFPLRAPIRVALATSLAEAAPFLGATLAVIAVLYAWVVSTGLSFEEAAVEAASERARRVELRRATRASPGLLRKVKSTGLWLPRKGPPWIALTWKNLVAARRISGFGLVLVLLGTAAAVLVISRIRRDIGDFLPAVSATIAVSMAGFFAAFGPSMLTTDVRHDLQMVDVLRTMPLTGRQLVLGEILAPALILTGLQWILWLAGAAIGANLHVPGLDGPIRLVVVVSAMLFGPALSLAGLCVQNAAAILFPAWVSSEARAEGRGFEAMGQRLLTLAGTMIVLTVGLIPSTVLGTLVGVGAAYFWGIYGVIPGAALASAALVLECWLALRLLGTMFERFDLTE